MMRNYVKLAAAAGFLSLSSAAMAADKTCELKIEGNDAMQFNTKEMTVEKDCTDVKVTLKHAGKLPKASMGHDWVLTKAADMMAIVGAAGAAGAAKDYLPEDAKIIAHTKMVGGGEESSVTFKASLLKAGEKYKYFCTFPGHFGVMQGNLTAK